MTEQQEKDTVKMLDKYINRYNQICDTASIEQLLTASDKIAGVCYTLATVVANRGSSHLQAYVDRKLFTAGQKLFFMSEGMSATKSQAKTEDTEGYKTRVNNEIASEMLYKEMDLKRQQANKVLDSIRQRISWMKKEEELTRMQGSNNNQK